VVKIEGVRGGGGGVCSAIKKLKGNHVEGEGGAVSVNEGVRDRLKGEGNVSSV